jgi:hypothetical protein
MPIRMVEDPNERDPVENGGGGNRGGGGGLGSLLPLLLGFLIRRPKLLIPLLIIGGVVYFFQGGCGGGLLPSGDQQQSAAFSTGADLKQEEYAKQDIFNFLYDDNISNPLPESVSLLKYAPSRGNQGAQGSCVAWASAYAARTILYARQTGQNPDDVKFSPSFMYNQIKLPGCQGSYLQRAMDNMSKVGAVPFGDFSYDPNDCDRRPPGELMDKARNFTIYGAQRLSDGENKPAAVNVKSIRQSIAAGAPVVIGMMVGGTFMQDMMGQKVWHPSSEDRNMRGFGGHAMCVIGYDDNLEGGAFQIMNSWGPEWGENGVAWVRYKDFVDFNKEAMALAPMGMDSDAKTKDFIVEFSLMNSNTKKDIELRSLGGGVFETGEKLSPGTPFKIKFKNNLVCYSYIFGQETDNSSYVLYPYTQKHSPYCGIAGTRVFPYGYNMTPDDKGNRDRFAVLITQKPLDYKKLNDKINGFSSDDFSAKIVQALGEKPVVPRKIQAGATVTLEVNQVDLNMSPILMIIEVKK